MANKKSKKRGVGKPRYYDSPEEMQVAIDDYFEKNKQITITGLALHLGFSSRLGLITYEGYSQEYYNTIKRAKSKVEEYYEKLMQGKNATGPIFALKNFKWTDKQQIEHTGDMGINIVSFKDLNKDKKD